MSDGMVTPPLMTKARQLTSTPELTTGVLKRMRHEEPHLYKELMSIMSALLRQILEESGPAEAAEAAHVHVEALGARLYAALRLGHEKLWRKTSGVIDPSGPAAALPEALRAEVSALIAEGQKIEAIRKIRAAANLGLKEAKEIVDHLEGEVL
jgi:hypothetical protein